MKKDNLNSLIALGTGTSTGIPMMGCHCQVCSSIDHRDQRLRTSIFIETKNGKKILVDTTPDLRTQFLVNQISDLDFVVITHDHADHLHGIDDLRPLAFSSPDKYIPLYCCRPTRQNIESRFPYIFKTNFERASLGGGIPRLELKEVILNQHVLIEDEPFYFFKYPHGHGETMGFVHDGLGYIVDCLELPQEILHTLKSLKLKLLIIDCLKKGSHSTHLTVDKAFQYVEEIRPERAGLTHISHALSHRELLALSTQRFGKKVFPLFDQLKLFY